METEPAQAPSAAPRVDRKGKGKAHAIDEPQNVDASRSPTLHLDEVERKLNDFRDLDSVTGPPALGVERDEHNIDDMYGSVPPRWRSRAPDHQPAHTDRAEGTRTRTSRRIPEPATSLLWMKRVGRGDDQEEDEFGRILSRLNEVEVRRGMEEGTQRLVRKMPLVKRKKRKPNALLNYCVGEDR